MIEPRAFTELLLDALPYYCKEVLKDIRPSDGFMGSISTGEWGDFMPPKIGPRTMGPFPYPPLYAREYFQTERNEMIAKRFRVKQ